MWEVHNVIYPLELDVMAKRKRPFNGTLIISQSRRRCWELLPFQDHVNMNVNWREDLLVCLNGLYLVLAPLIAIVVDICFMHQDFHE